MSERAIRFIRQTVAHSLLKDLAGPAIDLTETSGFLRHSRFRRLPDCSSEVGPEAKAFT